MGGQSSVTVYIVNIRKKSEFLYLSFSAPFKPCSWYEEVIFIIHFEVRYQSLQTKKKSKITGTNQYPEQLFQPVKDFLTG